MAFKHVKIKIPKAVMIESKGPRRYKVPGGGKYPSITTVLNGTKDMTGIKYWRRKVGYEVADYILKQAGMIGSATHEMIGDYLSNKKRRAKEIPLLARAHFENMRKHLDKMGEIYGIEIPMYSDRLKIAGTADCIARYGRDLAVIDFKTARSSKIEKWMDDYFLQAAAYAAMFEEHTAMPVKKTVIIISSEQGQSEALIRDTAGYAEKMEARIKEYYSRQA